MGTRSASPIQASFAQTVAASSAGLVGYWKFDETDGQMLLDSSPHAQHMMLDRSDAVALDDPVRIASGVVGVVPQPASWLLMLGCGLMLVRRLRLGA